MEIEFLLATISTVRQLLEQRETASRERDRLAIRKAADSFVRSLLKVNCGALIVMALLEVHRQLRGYFARMIPVNDLTAYSHILVKPGAPCGRYAVVKRVYIKRMNKSVARGYGAVRKLSHSALCKKTFPPRQLFASPFNLNNVST